MLIITQFFHNIYTKYDYFIAYAGFAQRACLCIITGNAINTTNY